ncbi:hypothetical protein E1180_19170 [Roseibium denhamense]|uniref:hypothetical protein n=1 Tax=Roseibium denhamense TaxID=76305 RepID=UPI0012BBDC59|nr:hypothetical protein [Roseibium denhamense]MTI07626.1 hypothetical protein [Roseibium denhamense]
MAPKKLKSPRLTAELAAEIKALWKHTELNQAQIAAKLGGLNQGRVSEVINGLRYAEVLPSERI